MKEIKIPSELDKLSHEELLKYIKDLEISGERSIKMEVSIITTYRCQMGCKMCNIWKNPNSFYFHKDDNIHRCDVGQDSKQGDLRI